MTALRSDHRIVLNGVQRTYALARLSARLGRVVALDCPGLEVFAGERLGVIGRNGAGKSTLLRMIAGLESPSRGLIEVRGRVTSVLTLGVGLRDELSGRDNIVVDGQLRGLADGEVQGSMQAIIDFAELGEFIDRPVRTYSTGMKARLGFAMISQLDPEILLIDETLSVGDVAFSRKATARIRQICERGKIVVVVSHSMQSIRDMCNRCIWLDGGRVVMDGDPERVTRAYEDAVRSADESALRQRFGALEGTHTRVPGWAVTGLRVEQPERAGAVRLVASGSEIEIRMAIRRPNAVRGQAVVQILRLDGLLVFERVIVLPDSQPRVRIHVRFAPLDLWVGSYRVVVMAGESAQPTEEPASSCSYVFEVFADTDISGGRPVIRPRCAGVSRPLSSEDSR